MLLLVSQPVCTEYSSSIPEVIAGCLTTSASAVARSAVSCMPLLDSGHPLPAGPQESFVPNLKKLRARA